MNIEYQVPIIIIFINDLTYSIGQFTWNTQSNAVYVTYSTKVGGYGAYWNSKRTIILITSQ